MNDIDMKLKSNFENIIKVFGIFWMISWILWLIWFVGTLTSGNFFWPSFVRLFIIAATLLAASVLAFISWYGMFNFKKRTSAIVISNFLFGLVSSLLIGAVWIELLSAGANNVVSFLIYWFIMLLILKNKEKFTK